MEENKSLVNIVSQVSHLEQMLIESNGEITPEIEAALAVKDFDLPQKVDSYAAVMDRMLSVYEYYSLRAAALAKLASSAKMVIDRCNQNLKFSMQTMNADELKGNDVRFKLVKTNPAVVVVDETKIPADYVTTKTVTTTSIDKKRIAEDLKLGLDVAGTKLEQGVSLRRYLNRPN